jgi:transcriptional regulator with XRE-family HTH domain
MDSELGDFLRTRRARLRPADVGVASFGARRVPGLRREELAQLAGVSVTYYTRLEQGQSKNASDEVLDAIARALHLDADETAHLRNIARPADRKRRASPRSETARPGVRQLISSMDGVAVALMDRRNDVLAWNRLGHELLASHYAFDSTNSVNTRANMTRMHFLDPHTRELFVRWDEEAKRTVASLRLLAGTYPDDRHLAELVGELCMKSPEFSVLWSRHRVLNCRFGVKVFAHPVVGLMELNFEVAHLPDEGHRLIMYSAEPGTSSEAALRLLDQSVSVADR